jgi:ribosome-associated protein
MFGPAAGRVTLAPGAWAPSDDLHFTFSRASGPGGQNVNKLNTRAELRIAVTAIRGLDRAAQQRLRRLAGKRLVKAADEVLLIGQSTRSQLDNKRACLSRLCILVNQALIPPVVRKPTKPTAGARARRLSSKRVLSEKKARRRAQPE